MAGTPAGIGPFGASIRVSSHAELQSNLAEAVLTDGETHRFTLYASRTFGDRLELAMEVPFIRHSGGFMDRFIDSWHQAFGLREGIRPDRSTDLLDYRYRIGDDLSLPITDSTSGLGDVLITADIGLGTLGGADPGGIAWTIRFGAELPTGSAASLTGNGDTDFSIALRAAGRAGSRWHWQAGAGVTRPGGSPEPLLRVDSAIIYYDVAFVREIGSRTKLALQLGGHSGPYESGLDALGGNAALAALSIARRTKSGHTWRIGFIEDLKAGTSADFALEVGFAWRGSKHK
jgi:hypothetical protein